MRRIKKWIIQIFLGIVLGRLVIQPFVTAIFWIQFHDRIKFSYFEWLYQQFRDPQSLLSAWEIFLAYSVLGIGIVVVISRFMAIAASSKRTEEFLQREWDANIDHIIAGGESATVEFKSSLRWDMKKQLPNKALDRAIVKTIAAFLNSEGGVLLIGVSDAGEILGIEPDVNLLVKKDLDGFELILWDLISARLGADLAPNIKIVFHEIEDKKICRVMVTSTGRPVYSKENNDSKFYVRSGVSTRELNVQEAVQYIASAQNK